jgi:peptidoglycan/xylan/chitin deacetylase (PgdA/CDA1 family)
MLREIKQATLRGFKHAGIFERCLRSRWRRQRLLVLCYHGISLEDEHHWNPGLYVQTSLLEARLRLLAEGGYSVLPLDEAVKRLYAHDLPPASVVITVDDGHYDFYPRAYPLFKKFGFPVTLYLSSFYTEFNRPIFDGFCSYLLWKARGYRASAKADIGLDRAFDLATVSGRAGAARAIKQFTVRERLDASEKDRILRSLAAHLQISYEELAAKRILQNLNPAEVSLLAKDGISIQLHTHRHRTPLDRDLFLREITDNRACIVKMTGANPTHFCYPSGVHDSQFIPWLTEADVVSATTCDRGLNSSDTHPLLLSRILDHSGLRPIEVEGWLTGCSALLPHRTVSRPGD